MSNEKQKIDVALVGGGVVGLWCALALLKKFPQLTLAVFESEKYLGEHTSGRNSEVLHSGIYYPTGSLKHLECVRGNLLWREFVKEKNLPFLGCGKVIAARHGQEEGLEKLLEQARKNQVPGVQRLSPSEVQGLQSILHIHDGFSCASSGVLNVAESLLALRNEVEARGGLVLLSTRAELKGHSSEGFLLEINGDEILAMNLVNTAGLNAIGFRASLGLRDYENFYVKGSYLKLKRNLGIEKLVYPLPPASGLGLGVHLTLDTAGGQKFGPDTEIVEKPGYGVDDSLIERMFPAIREVFQSVKKEDLQLAYSGIRPKIKRNGSLVTDFVFQSGSDHKIGGYFEFLGIESPGVTAAPALAQRLCEHF